MKFLGMKKVRDGKYLKNYELSYENKAGRLKTYEIVSRKELEDVQDLGRRASGVSIVAFQDGKMLLLREFRMSINKTPGCRKKEKRLRNVSAGSCMRKQDFR